MSLSTAPGFSSDDFQFWQYYRFFVVLVMKKHAIINGKIGYAFLLENLPSIGENDCTFNSVVWRFKETGERAVLILCELLRNEKTTAALTVGVGAAVGRG